MRIGLLSNLRAGRNRAHWPRLVGALDGIPGLVHVKTASAGAVPDALYELARRDVDVLAVNGGDGTLAHALTAILRDGAFDGRIPLVAPMRGGRTNMSALDIGASRDRIRALGRLVDTAARGLPVERRVLRVEIGDGLRREVRYGMFFGAGSIHRGIELVHRLFPAGRSQGVLGASLVTAALLSRAALLGDGSGVLTPDKIQILSDGLAAGQGESRLLMATTLDRLFLRLRPFWGEGPGSVRLTAIGAHAPGFGRALPGILAGRPGRGVDEARGFLSRRAHRVDLSLGCGLTIDGELLPPARRTVSLCADERIRFLRV